MNRKALLLSAQLQLIEASHRFEQLNSVYENVPDEELPNFFVIAMQELVMLDQSVKELQTNTIN